MAQPGAAKQLAHSDTFVDEINTEVPDAQPPASVFKLVRVGDDREVAARFEVFAADFILGQGRGLLPGDYRYVRLIASAPFTITTEQRFKDAWSDLDAPQRALAGEFPHDLHPHEDFAERIAVDQTDGRGGFVFDEVELPAPPLYSWIECGLQPPARVRGAEAGGDRDQPLFVRRQAQLGA